MNYYRNIRLLYIIIFFHNLIPAYVIERLFWQERGMNIQMVVYTEIIYAVTIIILEIPSGVLADRLGRKSLIVIGSFISALEFLMLIFAHSFWHFGLIVFIAGISKACTSGSWNALLYDSLDAELRQNDYEKILGRINALDFTAATIAALLGSAAAGRYGLLANYKISVVSGVISFAASLFLKEPSLRTEEERKSTLRSILSQSFMFFKNNINVLVLLLHATVIAACVNYIDEFWQLYMENSSVKIIYFGIIATCILVIRVPGALIAGWLLKYVKPFTIITAVSLLSALGFIQTSLSRGINGLMGMMLICMMTGITEPVVSGYLHHRADGSARATIDSITSLMQRGFTIAAGLIFSYVSVRLSINHGYLAIGAACLLVTMIFYIRYKKIEQ